MANLVTPMPMIRARFFDDNGRPLSGGKIYTYEPNTTTPKTTYKDLAATTPNANPISLDVAGEADIYFDGLYRVVVQSWRGEQLYDKDNVGGLAQIKASFVVDASGKTQQEVNDAVLYSVSSAEKLRLTAPIKKGQKVYLASHILDNGKGGGVFVATQKSGLKDNGGTVFSSPVADIFWVRTDYDAITPEMFGVKGDGITDDSGAMQSFIKYKFESKYPMSVESYDYGVSKTLIIPQNFDNTYIKDKFQRLDFCGANFVLLADVTLFTSGYTNASGFLVSNYDTATMSYNSFGINFGNFTISSVPAVGYPTTPALTIQDWHQDCEIKAVSSHIHTTLLKSKNNFYTKFTSLNGSYSGSGGKVGERFQFYNEHNLCTFKNLIGVNSNIGYRFYGPVTACTFTENSIEGMTTGLVFDASVYGFGFFNNYCENFETVLKFNSYFQSVVADNNYVNYVAAPSTSYFMDYTSLPGCGIDIRASNFFLNQTHANYIVKVVENVNGAGLSVHKEALLSSSIDSLVPTETLGKNYQFYQKIGYAGFRAKVTPTVSYNEAYYSGRYTDGYANPNGFKWNDLGTTELQLDTKILDNKTQRIYVNIDCLIGGVDTFIKGELWGGYPARFYEYTDTGVTVSTKLNLTVVNGFVRIGGTLSGVPTAVKGEVRLI